MKFSLRLAAILSFVLSIPATAPAAVIDFDYASTNGVEITVGYGNTADVASDYRVLSGAFEELGRLKWSSGVDFSQPSGGVAFDDAQGNDPSKWGEVQLSVDPASNYRLALSSFTLCRYGLWDPSEQEVENLKLSASIAYDGVVLDQFSYWELSGDGQTTVVQVNPAVPVDATSILIRWNFPFRIAVDDIAYSLNNVPEPATWLGWTLGCCALALVLRRQRLRGGRA